MIASYSNSLPIDIPHDVAVDIGIAIQPIPVRLNVIELDVVAIITNVSNDFKIVVIVLYFRYLCSDLLFLSWKYVIISLVLLIWLLKLLRSFNFFSSCCSKSIISNGADGYNPSVFAFIYME